MNKYLTQVYEKIKNNNTYKVLRTMPGNINSSLMLNVSITIFISELSVQIYWCTY